MRNLNFASVCVLTIQLELQQHFPLPCVRLFLLKKKKKNSNNEIITRNKMPRVDVWPLGLTRVKMFTSLLGKISFVFFFFFFCFLK